MNIKTTKPNPEGKDTAGQLSALSAYVENLKTEISIYLATLSKRIDTIERIIDTPKEES